MSQYGGSGAGSAGGGSYAARSAAAHAASYGGGASSYGGGGGAGSYGASSYSGAGASNYNYSAPAAAAAPAPAAAAPVATSTGTVGGGGRGSSHHHPHHQESPAEVAHQNRLLTDATRRVQEHTYYMNKAMAEEDGLPTVLEHAAMMLAELGDPNAHHRHQHHATPGLDNHHHHHHHSAGAAAHLSPKSYYELHMRILNEMPNLEEYLLNLSTAASHSYSLQELYESVQYCPKVVPRLYLQICAGSALIRTETVPAKTVLMDLIEAVKCVQCPVRGLFLRSYLLQATRDKLPDVPLPSDTNAADDHNKQEQQQNTDASTTATSVVDASILSKQTKVNNGTVEDAHKFVLQNFIEMNKLWVRVQYSTSPSAGASSRHDIAGSSSSSATGKAGTREARRRRERERNELRILVGTNLVRLSQLECVTTQMYATSILPAILNQITSCRDPLAQAYLMDCIIQVFPDEFHIETLEVFLDVCPKLRDKVNVRTIVQSIMERLSNYYADEMLLLDAQKETETEEDVKKENSFQLLNSCIQRIVTYRQSTMPNKEIVRLQMALLKFTLKCYPGNMAHVNQCLASCATSLRTRQENAKDSAQQQTPSGQQQQQQQPGMTATTTPALDETTITELENLLSIPLESLALKVLQLDHYSDLLTFLPWDNRRQVAVVMLKAVETSGSNLTDLDQIEELFVILTPLILENNNMADNYQYGQFLKQQEQEELEEEREEKEEEEQAMQHAASDEEHDKRTADLMGALGIQDRSTTTKSTSKRGLGGGTTTTGASSVRMPKPAAVPRLPQGSIPTNINFSVEEQNLLAKLLHLLHHDDTDVAYKMLVLAKQHLCRGGITPRLKFTLPSIAFESLKLLKKVRKMEMVVVEENSVDAKTEKKEEKEEKEKETEKKEETKEEEEEEEEEKEEKEGDEEKEEGEDTEKEEGEKETEEKAEEPAAKEEEEKETEKTPHVAATPPPFTKKINCRKIFVFIQKTIAMLSLTDPEASFKLNLEAAIAADRCAVLSAPFASTQKSPTDFNAISYEFIAQSFQLYEDEISESKAQQRSIEMVVGTLLSCKMFEKDDYEALITKTAQYAAKLLKKPDQCKMVTLCSHLFFTGVNAEDKGAYRNPQRVLECLQRALKIADACSMSSSANVSLFVEILELYVYYFERDNPVISDKFVSGLVALIKEHMESIGFSSSADQMVFAETQGHYRQILRYLQKKKDEAASAEKFANVVI